MFFILSKLLLFLISPFFWFSLAFFGALFLPHNKLKAISKWTAISIFVLFTNSFIFLKCCGLWEIHGKPINQVKNYDVGIVLTGMAEYNNDLKLLSIRRGADRIWQAISLYHSGKIKKILISGDNGYISDRGLHEAKQLKEVLVLWKIPEKDIIAENFSRNTYENAVESKKILDRSYPHFKQILLITSGKHMRRALACFDKVGLSCDTYSTDLFTGPSDTYFWDQYLIPDVSNFVEWHALLKEIVGFMVYDLTGYI